jgi:L-threonylcarbamoyladenylate synthase
LDKIEGKKEPHVIRVYSPKGLQSAIDCAAQCLRSGGLVAYPTETFYGLAVDATNEVAIRKLFFVKARQKDRPILVLIPSVKVLKHYVRYIPPIADQLMSAFWPGALTLVFEAGSTVSPLLTAGTGKIGVRLSSHPIATALTRSIGVPISGTSANISGEPSCRNAENVLRIFVQGVDLILDGGETTGNIGSTILDVTADPPYILREGMIKKRQLEAFICA